MRYKIRRKNWTLRWQ